MKYTFLIAFILGLLVLGPHPDNSTLVIALLVYWAAFIIGERLRMYCWPPNDEPCQHCDHQEPTP